ncbi:MAG: HNH endonuclease [Gemmatimonadales bacterium]
MPTCIYCTRTDPSCGFHREHVVPEALGTFEKGDVITLTEEVCAECNQYFGDTLELFLNRDSAEATLRFRYGLKDPVDVHKFFRHRVQARMPRDGSQFGGAYLDFVPPPAGQIEPYVDIVPQFGFERRDGKGWEYFTEQEFKDEPNWPKRIATDLGPQRVILYNSDDSKRRLWKLTEERLPLNNPQETQGIKPFSSDRVNAEVELTFDKVLARAVAKIAFNYLTKVHGAALALRPEFDAVRQFVRYDQGKPPDFVDFRTAPVLRDFSGKELPPRGHLLTVGWDKNGKDILARVSPFQYMMYIVRLGVNYTGKLDPEDSAHLYDLKPRRAEKLRPAKIVVPGSGQS